MDNNFRDKLKSGVMWSSFRTLVMTVLHFMTGVVLARLLEPSDFGVFIAASGYIAILLTQVRFGFPEALIQRKVMDEVQLNSCFWVMQVASIFTLFLLLFTLGYLDSFYDGGGVEAVGHIMALNLLLMPYIAAVRVILRRDMDFKTLSKVNIASNLYVIPVTIVLAYLGFGAISLAIGGLMSMLISAYLLWHYKRWLPGFVSFRKIKELVRYSWNTYIILMINTASTRVDKMMIGSLSGVAALGFYNRSASLANLPVELVQNSLSQIIFGVLSKFQGDKNYSNSLYVNALCFISLFVFPVLFVLYNVADDFIIGLYGGKWSDAVVPLKVLVFAAFLSMVKLLIKNVSAAQDLLKNEKNIQLVMFFLLLIMIYWLAGYGVIAIAVGYVVLEFVSFLLLSILVSRVGIKIKDTLYAVLPALIVCVGSMLLTASIYEASINDWFEQPLIKVVGYAIIYIIFYLSLLWVLIKIWRNHLSLQAFYGISMSYLNKAVRQ